VGIGFTSPKKIFAARILLAATCLTVCLEPLGRAQTKASAAVDKDAELKFVVYFSRHGVRSPTGLPSQYNKYSHAEWPAWEVAPGILTPHGYHLMELFGAYDRLQLASQGLFNTKDCSDAAKVTFYADSDQRTRETGKALAKGLFPGCNVPVPSLAEGTNDPLFHLSPADAAKADHAWAMAAIAGRIGNSPDNLTEAYRPQLAAFDDLLATCGTPATYQGKRASLFDIPATLSAGQGDHLTELRGPINTASTLAENILLEYAEGMDASKVGWGCGNAKTVRSLIAIHTAATDITQRTPTIATTQSANLLNQIDKSIQQAVEQRAIPGAIGKKTDRALFLIGHDTNILNIAGALNLTWIVDGRRDDTPPGGVLIFELWQRRNSHDFEVRLYFSAQTLEQMRSSTPLDLSTPPQRVPVFIPGCSSSSFACTWPSFSEAIHQAQKITSSRF
jgi:4-phytase / acid phosphatase